MYAFKYVGYVLMCASTPTHVLNVSVCHVSGSSKEGTGSLGIYTYSQTDN